MQVLSVGDIIGKPGREALKQLLPGLRQQYGIDLVVANGENAAGGFGLTPETAREMLDCGVDVITSGNHIWAQKEIVPYLEGDTPVLRPMNYPSGAPGRGYIVRGRALVVNIIGRTFMQAYDCPFRGMDRLLAELPDRPRIIIVDFHAEATSEKSAMGLYLDGRVSALLGTHTHVGTTDMRILPRGTAFVSDIGMTGPVDSVIGMEPEEVLQTFLSQRPHRFVVARGRVAFNGILVNIDDASGRATKMERLYREVA